MVGLDQPEEVQHRERRRHVDQPMQALPATAEAADHAAVEVIASGTSSSKAASRR